MKMLQNENNSPGNARTGKITDEQVDLVVRGFVQVWNRFEDELASEIAASAHLEKGEAAESRLHNGYDLLFRVGNILNHRPSLTMGEMSAALSVPLSTATRIVGVLVEQGYVQRLPDAEDRRVVRIGFTPGGKALYQFLAGQITTRVRRIAACLTEKELAELLVLLNKVIRAVKTTLR